MDDNVPMEVKKERLQRLNAVLQRIISRALKQYEGQIVEVLVEGASKKRDEVLAGYTRRNKLVNFEGPKELVGQV